MKARINTDALRAFLGTGIQTWAPILVLLGVIHWDAQTLAAVTLAMVWTINGLFSVVKAEPPPPPPPSPLPANAPMQGGGVPAQVDRPGKA